MGVTELVITLFALELEMFRRSLVMFESLFIIQCIYISIWNFSRRLLNSTWKQSRKNGIIKECTKRQNWKKNADSIWFEWTVKEPVPVSSMPFSFIYIFCWSFNAMCVCLTICWQLMSFNVHELPFFSKKKKYIEWIVTDQVPKLAHW
jgi:hypothetical protein